MWMVALKHPSVRVLKSGHVTPELVLSLTPLHVTFVDDLRWHLTLPLSSLDDSVSCCSGDPPDVLSSTEL